MKWNILKSLAELDERGETRKTKSLEGDRDIQRLVDTRKLLYWGENSLAVKNREKFKSYYMLHHEQNYGVFLKLFAKHRFDMALMHVLDERDIQILLGADRDVEAGSLAIVRAQMIERQASIRVASKMFFKNEKHLDGQQVLTNCLKSILDIPHLADDKDQQYVYVLPHPDPKAIVICENLDFLRRPTPAREHRLELWYAGGRNVKKMAFTSPRALPMFYSADWDRDGLEIFQMVRNIFPAIQLLYPDGKPGSITDTEHDSLWTHRHDPMQLSGLNPDCFQTHEQALIRQLIDEDAWICEESNWLIEMLRSFY